MEQRGEALVQLTNQSAELLSHDVCSKHHPATELMEQVSKEWGNEGMGISVLQISELEDMWAGEEQVLRHTLNDVEEKVSFNPFLTSLILVSFNPFLTSLIWHVSFLLRLQEAEWKRAAVSSIRQLSLLSMDISSKDQALLAKVGDSPPL